MRKTILGKAFKVLTVMLFVIIVVGLSIAAYGSDASATAANSVIGNIGDFFTKNVLPLAGTALVGIIGMFVKNLASKAGVESNTAQQALVTAVASTVVGAVEEQVANAVKNGLPKISSTDKLALAVDKVTAATGIKPAAAADAIHAAIAAIPNLGATGPKSIGKAL